MVRESALSVDTRSSGPLVPAPQVEAPLLKVRGLEVTYRLRSGGLVRAVRGIDLSVARGELVALVGESGSGKSTVAQSLMRLLPPTTRISGQVLFEGKDILTLSGSQMRRIRCGRIGMVFQDPNSTLNPVLRIGRQIDEALREHTSLDRAGRTARSLELLRSVHLPDPESLMSYYPHQISGGMRQRVTIALAISGGADLLLADEPTTALDVTTQAQIMGELVALHHRRRTGTLLITHNLALAASVADRIVVMYGGEIVESGTTAEVFATPVHPYTRGLLKAIPRLDTPRDRTLPVIAGNPPRTTDTSPGCRFAARCVLAEPRCREQAPELLPESASHRAACWVTSGEL